MDTNENLGFKNTKRDALKMKTSISDATYDTATQDILKEFGCTVDGFLLTRR